MVATRSLAVALVLAACVAMGNTARSAAPFDPCPENEMSLNGAVFRSTAATVDSTIGEFRVAYDLAAGRLEMRQCCSLQGSSLTAFDDFDVSGVPAGTPVSFTAVLTVDGAVWTPGCGSSGCAGYYTAHLIHGATVDDLFRSISLYDGRRERHDVLSIPITIVAGQPERLEFRLFGGRNPGGHHGSEALAVLSFTGLPQDVHAYSCQGYSSAITPVRRATWGELKVRYR